MSHLLSLKYKFIYYHFCVMLSMRPMNICNVLVNYDEIIIQRSLVFNICSKYPISRILEKDIKIFVKKTI